MTARSSKQADPGSGLFQMLRFHASDPGQPGVDLRHTSLRHLLAHRRKPTHPLVDPEIEQRNQQVLAIARLVVEESGELTLGQEHTTAELVEAQPETLFDRGRHIRGTGCDHLIPRLQPRLDSCPLPGARIAPNHPG